ncbi:MAG: S41 family peptidase [Planctomycetota bacterium]
MLPFPARLASVLILALPSSAQTKLLRFPDIRGDRVAFCYAGDLWTAPSGGGTATRLTAHEGLELFPKFSPDGQWIAFTGQYDGDEQVYVIPATGGVPRQLTWYPARGPLPPRWGYDNQVYGWTKDSQRVLFRGMRDGWSYAETHLYTVDLEGGLPVKLPMPVSGAGDLSPGETQVVYTPLARDFRTWKRYQGGWAQDLYIYDLKTARVEPVAHSPRTERDPMWIGNQIVFASDRDGTLNLFAYDIESKQTSQLTQRQDWDVRWPSKGEDGEIVYEGGGELHVFDTRSRKDRAISIMVPNDGVAMRPSRVSAERQIEGFNLSPKGERALIVARGDVFTAPIEKGPTRNLTHSSNAHDRSAAWSPDGAKVAYISDESGEDEVYLVAQDGNGMPERLTTGGQTRREGLIWAPDGKRLAFSDSTGRIHSLEIATKTVTEVARDRSGNVGDFSWSGDGGWLTFSLADPNGFRSLWLWNAAEAKLTRVTDETFNETEPVFDPAGKYLYYLSDREYAPQISGVEWNFATDRTTGIFALALRKDVEHPFPPQSDEVTVKKDDAEKKDGEKADEPKKDEEKKDETKKEDEKKDDAKKDEEKPKEPVKIDLEGLAARVARVPVDADDLSSLQANKENLIYVRGGPFFYGRESSRKRDLMVFNLKDRKASVLAEDVSGTALSLDGNKILVRQERALNLYDASPKGKDSKKTVPASGLMVDRVPKQEWINIYNEVWRRFRDYFYVENMHGYDWGALRRQYGALLEFVAHRSDLNYVMGELVSELNVGHAYISGGDWAEPERPKVALPGCRFELDPNEGRYRIASIFAGQNEEDRYRSPLTEIGVDARVGDYVLAIDGEDLAGKDNPYRLLRDKADRPVELTLNDKPTREGARTVKYRPITSETDLVYLNWVAQNRARVDELSAGRIGYLHLPNMGAEGIREFVKWYYGLIRKEGLIIDDRWNGGGNVSQMVLERLRRTMTGTGFSRNSDFTETYPGTVFVGPMACLLNENSASDGDIFPWMFREAKLGPLIGKRSWGGVVGITNHGPLIDGGGVNVPEFGHADAKGQWAVEGHGVDPDIVVENDPASLIAGKDPQLERAIEEVKKKLPAKPGGLPVRPPAPVKTK